MDPLAVVVAVARNGVIGRGGELPWHIPEDLRHFQRVTTGHAIVMGRRTYESIGRPLPRRRSIVVSRRPGLVIEGCEVAPSVEAAIALARTTDAEPRVIGGAGVYAAALPLATRIYLTRVERDVDGDVSFPSLDPAQWREVERRDGETPGVVFVTLDRATTAVSAAGDTGGIETPR